ncbi:MAG: nucleotide sugar dehydrogenase [Winogradskyella sp.]|nr:nucleotide sugar dehydrogenase [Winogradskyella sp.]
MNKTIAIIGLGYVGLPLAVEFAKKYKVVGFDINKDRINTIKKGHDNNLEIEDAELKRVLGFNNGMGLELTFNNKDIKECNVFIITVPTPIDKNNKPLLDALIKASKTVSIALKKGDIVVYESTVYPGVTEDECVPVLEMFSGLKFNKDFYCGYSPERINPGDKTHRLKDILKITSGSTKEAAIIIDNLYKDIICAGTHLVSSIKIAEAAKVIENAQRDINIAFVNELAKIFNKLNLDTHEVLAAASTKWNFLPFKPGLVGGHCIGVDPFYLAQKAQEAGYYSEIILASRRLNDSMSEFVSNEIVKLMILNKIPLQSSKILLLGATFKENCPDITNSKAIEVYKYLSEYNFRIDVFDPWADYDKVKEEYGIPIISKLTDKRYDVIVHLVAHKEFLSLDYNKMKKALSVVYDVKGTLPKAIIDKRL